jgi:hypothetical protein
MKVMEMLEERGIMEAMKTFPSAPRLYSYSRYDERSGSRENRTFLLAATDDPG